MIPSLPDLTAAPIAPKSAIAPPEMIGKATFPALLGGPQAPNLEQVKKVAGIVAQPEVQSRAGSYQGPAVVSAASPSANTEIGKSLPLGGTALPSDLQAPQELSARPSPTGLEPAFARYAVQREANLAAREQSVLTRSVLPSFEGQSIEGAHASSDASIGSVVERAIAPEQSTSPENSPSPEPLIDFASPRPTTGNTEMDDVPLDQVQPSDASAGQENLITRRDVYLNAGSAGSASKDGAKNSDPTTLRLASNASAPAQKIALDRTKNEVLKAPDSSGTNAKTPVQVSNSAANALLAVQSGLAGQKAEGLRQSPAEVDLPFDAQKIEGKIEGNGEGEASKPLTADRVTGSKEVAPAALDRSGLAQPQSASMQLSRSPRSEFGKAETELLKAILPERLAKQSKLSQPLQQPPSAQLPAAQTTTVIRVGSDAADIQADTTRVLPPSNLTNSSGTAIPSPIPVQSQLDPATLQQLVPTPVTPQTATPTPIAEAGGVFKLSPQLENTIDQLAQARSDAQANKPELTVRHQEFGAITMRLDASGNDLRATLSARDPGFVPAIQTALAERSVAASSEASGTANQRGNEQTGSQAGSQANSQSGSFAGSHSGGQGQGTQFGANYGSSTGGGQGTSQPYTGQTGSQEEDTVLDRANQVGQHGGSAADGERFA